MPAPNATTLKYSPVVAVDLSGNEINFADAEAEGHRVQIDVPAASLNGACKWTRASDSDRPIGNILSTPFSAALETALEGVYDDVDGIPAGLSFTSSAITNEQNKSLTTKKSNDLIMAYVLFKVYGSTNFNTTDKVYNAADALNMVDNATIATAVKDNIDVSGGGRGGPVDQMFRDLLAADPGRFFDGSGVQVTGLFETNADASGNGTWLIAAGDILELKLEFDLELVSDL